MESSSFSPKAFLKARRPERFSDSVVQEVAELDRSLLEYHLDSLTSRGQETDFERFARRLCEREICPNLLPQTGPTGGGDSKVDFETYPVTDRLALAWYVGVDSGASHERWAFAFSAKEDWRPKVRSDVAKGVTGNTGADRSRRRPGGQARNGTSGPTSAMSEPSSPPCRMISSAALSTEVHEKLRGHLLRSDGQEDVCFGLYRPSEGRARRTGVLFDIILPQNGERDVHGNASFSGSYFLRAAGEAAAHDAGLALLHSHPRGKGWQGMSDDDVAAERGYAAQAAAMTGLPFLGMTLAGDGHWSARFWERVSRGEYEKRGCETVRVAGDRLRITYDEILRPLPGFRPELERTVSAWGADTQANLARLRIGVIGAGSVGALVAEALARTGIGNLLLLDFDTVKVVNLDRLLHARRRDAVLARSKVETLRRALLRSATAASPRIEALEFSVVEEEGFRAALDCDVLFSCVDRPWPRATLNLIAYSHIIPVIDGGIKVATAGGRRLTAADWKAHAAAPGRRCLECLGQYDPGLVAAERDGLLDDPLYVEGLPSDHPIRGNQNVFAFSTGAASLEILQLLSMVVAPGGLADTGAQNYHFVTGGIDIDERQCQPGCLYSGNLLSTGNRSGITVIGRHHAAEQERAERARRISEPKIRAARFLDDLLARAY